MRNVSELGRKIVKTPYSTMVIAVSVTLLRVRESGYGRFGVGGLSER